MNDFRSQWEKILQEVKNYSVRDTYKSKKITFSGDITIFSEKKSQTFSHDKTIDSKNNCVQQTFSGNVTLQDNKGGETFSESRTVATKNKLGAVEFDDSSTSKDKNSKIELHQDYKNYKEINRGGMGIIYKAQQVKLKREVVIKKILPGVAKNKFIAESLVTAYLDHPNIVPVHEIDENSDGELLLAMKLVNGISWKNLLYPKTEEQQAKAREYNLRKHLEILLKVCDAISYAHSKGVIHCDLKPENIMIGDFGEVLVVDWGIAVEINKNYGEQRTFHKKDITTPMGTPCYMPPELAEGRGQDISYGTDVYLLGGILFEILHRRPPHTGKSLWLVLLAAKESKPPVFHPKISVQLQQTCKKSLAKNIVERYQSISEFKQAIENYLEHQESTTLANKATDLYNKATIFLLEQKALPKQKRTIFSKIFDKTPASSLPVAYLYTTFMKAIALYERAIELKPNNTKAQQNKIRCHEKIVTLALISKEINIAKEHLKILKNYGSSELSVFKLQMEKVYWQKKVKNLVVFWIWFNTSFVCLVIVGVLILLPIVMLLDFLFGIS
ncbi:serine/threonine-protein kinase [Candidatus Uabimicrobium amorphum]|uniref:Serine/threonine protein kinase n=1 Tax=Uabimicrobium amorphum TaxID=2596890 RepID=A0A5S9F5K7_UABAM|nr:serine/threonine-protein kinase [Candidatus Uabimicrobium amorphum]BBM86223.1 serine/threonine protein kinase [Candidatus Uabimicrobium amorphum]